MKKIFSLLLVFVILSMPAALAEEIDLSKFSYQELQALYRKVRIEMIQRPEWKDVIVHQGIYVIGKDIPEGEYTISVSPDQVGNVVLWGYAKDDYETDGGLLYNGILEEGNNVIGRIELKNGNILELSCQVVFSPLKGVWVD